MHLELGTVVRCHRSQPASQPAKLKGGGLAIIDPKFFTLA